MIKLRKVSKFYSDNDTVSTGFSRIDLELNMGEFVVITGESGSGKSTLLNVISGLDTYEEGEMFVNREDTSGYTTEDYEMYRKNYIGNIFQDFNLINSYTVYQNVELGMLLCGKSKSESKERILDLIEQVDLTKYAKTKVSKLSGGQKQRVAIARALAKESPIIVADEPTGNLDSKSAENIIEILHSVSKDKLVVVVTHNYEQVEKYVTRKITMHDGKIIEDKHVNASPVIEPDSAIDLEMSNLSFANQLRLGFRNTFNLPMKFILLLLIYLFMTTAVLGQYSSFINTGHQQELMGFSPFFSDISAERIIVQKDDKSEITNEDYDKISDIANISQIIKNDVILDSNASIYDDDYYFYGSVYSLENLQAKKITYGKLPKGDNEFAIEVNKSSYNYDDLIDNREKYFGKTYTLTDENSGIKISDDKIKLTGIIMDESQISMENMGSISFYVSEDSVKNITRSFFARNADTTFNFDGKTLEVPASGYNQVVKSSEKVAEGKAYIPEEFRYNYTNGYYYNKPLTIDASTIYFDSNLELTVDKYFTEKTINELFGINKDDYPEYSSTIFVNPKDFDSLFAKGYYQSTVYMDDEKKSDETKAALVDAGFKPLLMKEAITNFAGEFGFVLKLISGASLIVIIIVLFFIAYFVIRLVMKSRNIYYSTIRILGGTKENCESLIKIELLTVLLFAYGLVLAFIKMVQLKYINIAMLVDMISFLTLGDYIILFVILSIISLLIAKRYSKKLFKKSAMSTYREEE
ncbi:MAG: ABC transporter ATP-binding protein [Clostridiales bacterium]|nr:ABC transporter ATP-binding protein [Clostridiales bacterium]